jgi:two-component system cell cycle sensor histidine kinase/response regulator CckA
MKKVLKNYVIVVVLLLILSLSLFSRTMVDRLEMQFPNAGLKEHPQIERVDNEIQLLEQERENRQKINKFLSLLVLLIFVLAVVIHTRSRSKAGMILALEKEIEERRQTEKDLRESEEKFRILVEKAPVGIRIIRDNVIEYANPTAAKIFGYTPGEILGKNLLELVIKEDRPGVSQHLEQQIKGNSTQTYQSRGITREGDILHLEFFGSLIHYRGQPAILESIIDITSRKKQELEIIKNRNMEVVGALAGGIAHDFNNLLAVIIGNTGMLKLNIGSSSPGSFSLLDNIYKAAAQAMDLAQKFITFSAGGWMMRKKVRLCKILADIVRFSPGIAPIPGRTSLPPDLDFIYADEAQLRHAVTNLLLNAHEAAYENNKKIALTAVNITLEKGNPFSLKEGKYVKISVIDRGRGIPPELLEKVFDPYFSTKNTVNQKGLGLGLTICYSIIKKHEGHISITSKVKKGTTVDLYLPVYEIK